jgi:golgi-specific brefeldin A-resistance guanine nucleotide exchange factor 1
MMTLMRLNTKWAKQIYYPSANLSQNENSLVQAFRTLIEYLGGMFDIGDVDCVMYIQPFHQVIISDQASGPLTSAALSALSKFALYGFLDASYPNAAQGINLISNAICRCVFEETDWESDEVVLMKLLELSTMTLRCDASSHLTVKASWDIYSTCITIHNQFRASKILRSEAATALRHLTLSIFGRAHRTPLHSSVFQKTTEFVPISKSTECSLEDYASITWEKDSTCLKLSSPIGLTLIFGKIMTILSSLMDPEGQKSDGIKFALSLINIALEAGGPVSHQNPSFFNFLYA